jgi:hypothetical protein
VTLLDIDKNELTRHIYSHVYSYVDVRLAQAMQSLEARMNERLDASRELHETKATSALNVSLYDDDDCAYLQSVCCINVSIYIYYVVDVASTTRALSKGGTG